MRHTIIVLSVHPSGILSVASIFSLLLKPKLYLILHQRRDGMFTLNIMRNTRYGVVTAYCWTGSTDEFRGNILIYCQLRIPSRNSSVDPVQQ